VHVDVESILNLITCSSVIFPIWWRDRNLCKYNLERWPGAQTLKQRPGGPPHLFVDLCQQMLRSDLNLPYLAIHCEWSLHSIPDEWPVLPPSRLYLEVRTQKYRDWEGKEQNDILLKCTRRWWDSNPHFIILLETLRIQIRWLAVPRGWMYSMVEMGWKAMKASGARCCSWCNVRYMKFNIVRDFLHLRKKQNWICPKNFPQGNRTPPCYKHLACQIIITLNQAITMIHRGSLYDFSLRGYWSV
jgi:hypothetical protein